MELSFTSECFRSRQAKKPEVAKLQSRNDRRTTFVVDVIFLLSIFRNTKACTTPLIFAFEVPQARGLCEYTRHFVVICYNHIGEAARL